MHKYKAAFVPKRHEPRAWPCVIVGPARLSRRPPRAVSLGNWGAWANWPAVTHAGCPLARLLPVFSFFFSFGLLPRFALCRQAAVLTVDVDLLWSLWSPSSWFGQNVGFINAGAPAGGYQAAMASDQAQAGFAALNCKFYLCSTNT